MNEERPKSDQTRVAVFDDNPAILSLLTTFLERWGYEVVTFPRAAICPACRCAPGQVCADITISDVSMPGLSGLQFAEYQQTIGCKNKNVALMSGNWSESELLKAEKLGCKVFHKPFNITELKKWFEDCGKTIDPNRVVLETWFQPEAH